MPPDVLIIGAGAAGLAAAIELARAGVRVEIVEARERIGGRIWTKHDPALDHAVDLGAEFVHGLSPEIWLPLQQHDLKVSEVDGDLWCSVNGKLQQCNFFAQAGKILEEMNDKGPDESFLDFLARCFPGDDHAEAKRWATGYVSGFNAADPGLVSVHWLVHGRSAEEQIEGDRAFHIRGGYQHLLDIFLAEIKRLNVPIHLNTIVQGIQWRTGAVEVQTRSEEKDIRISVPRVLVTLPLGVLQSNSVRFDPELPASKQAALQKLAMGKIVRVILCFRERFWEQLRASSDSKTLGDLSFFFSRDEFFPTWWTQMPDPVPMIVGWAPARSAESLAGLTTDALTDKAVGVLSRLMQVDETHVQAQLSAAYFHDWDSDPYSRGAYSYVKVGGEGCQATLGEPLDNALFFAGEATDTSGHNGTVHGAIASGQRAAKEILQQVSHK
jgi:monoamine oxidase